MIDPIELHALADGELGAAEKKRLERLVAESPIDAAEYEAILNLKAVLHTKVEPVGDCQLQWKACVGRLNEMDKTRRIERFVGRYAWGVCGAFALAIVGSGFLKRANPSTQVQSADLARVVATLNPSPEPPSPDQQARDRWLDALLGQARQSIDPNRLQIRSAATGELDGRPVTRLALRDPIGDMALLVIPDVLNFDGMGEMTGKQGYRLGRIEGMNCVAWSDGRNSLVLIADRSHEDLATIASRMAVR